MNFYDLERKKSIKIPDKKIKNHHKNTVYFFFYSKTNNYLKKELKMYT